MAENERNTLFTLAEAAKFCNGEVVGDPNTEIGLVVIDSRNAVPGSMFAALKGEHADGEDFVEAALENGACCVLTTKRPKNGNAIVVKDTLIALMQIGSGYKNKTSPITIAVTGSVGKTTTKEFVASVVGMKYKTQKTSGNYNSVIGLPLTLLELKKDTEALVLEMGMSGLGEIESMSNATKPAVAIITNVGSSHLEKLGCRENILKAKMEITKGLNKNGLLILNGDDRMLWEKRNEKSDYVKVYVAIYNDDADYIAKNISISPTDIVFDLYERATGNMTYSVKVPAVGMHNVYNAMVSYVCAEFLGVGKDDIKKGILNYKTTGMRQKIYKKGEYTVIADCYNAAPESTKASIDVLMQTGRFATGRTHAFLGDMKELGVLSKDLHRRIGYTVTEKGISYLYTIGEDAEYIARGAIEAGMSQSKVFIFKGENAKKEAVDALCSHIAPKDTVLFKASRAMGLEDCIKDFEDRITFKL